MNSVLFLHGSDAIKAKVGVRVSEAVHKAGRLAGRGMYRWGKRCSVM
jgi:hypothetical protein